MNIINHLDELNDIMVKYDISKDDICLITSSCLAFAGIRSNRDLEFTLREGARKKLIENFGSELEINPYSKAIKFSSNIECDVNDYVAFGVEDDDLFKDEYSEVVGSYRIVKIAYYLCQKILQNRDKDLTDINLIKSSDIWNRELENNVEEIIRSVQKSAGIMPSYNKDEVWNIIFNSSKNVYIFGTGYIGRHVYSRVKRDNYTHRLSGFLVSDKRNTNKLYDKQIYDFSDCIDASSYILVSVKYNDMKEDMSLLNAHGFYNLIHGFQYWVEEIS